MESTNGIQVVHYQDITINRIQNVAGHDGAGH
jgi:hypothetical protein